jgi:CRISPR type III-B/RAMP module-associated protein Cmr5
MAKKYRKEQQQKAPSVKVEQKSAPPTPPEPTTPATASPPLLDRGGEQDVVLPATATLQQRRAHFALTRIRVLAEEWREDAKKQKEFNSYASAMPFMIHANGLGQTAAFYRRKGTEHTYYRLYKLLGDWLNQRDQPFAGQSDLLEGITQSNMEAYLAAQVEAMLFLDWVKKLASAFLAREEEVSA